MSIILGGRYKDVVTGFIGVATVRAEYLSGCVQFCLAPGLDKNNKLMDSNYFDEQQLVPAGKPIELPKRDAGGPTNNSPSTCYRG